MIDRDSIKEGVNFTYIDRIDLDKSHCIDCVLSEADFFTSHPNPYRIAKTSCEIRRCDRHRAKKKGVVK